MTLEQELIGIFAATPSRRNREILIGYYGWQDGRQHTLTEVGTRFGITRERVRQVCAKLTKRPKNAVIAAPTMDRALQLIADRLPAPAAEIERELVERGLTAVGMSLESLATAARLLGRPARFQIVTHTGKRTIPGRPGCTLDLSLSPTDAWRSGPTRRRPWRPWSIWPRKKCTSTA